MAEPTLYDKIIDGTIPSFKVWEDAEYVAFLTPFPNTPGFTVVTPKKNPGDNYIAVDDAVYAGLLLAAKKVATALSKAFGVQRVGLVIEGEGVPHLHVKLIPMHKQADTEGAHTSHVEFYEAYPGYLTTIEGPRMSDEELAAIQKKITEATK
ncbi:MAG TPA: HIT family protein [Patescibacteria group bacterium]|nr:HIT family protein [Patescibacteria group bacterium]